jgi:hypothetical protein
MDDRMKKIALQAPMLRTGAEGKVTEADPFGEEARFFTECRILQRDVEVVLESVSNQNFVGSIIHPVRSTPFFDPLIQSKII